MFIEFSLQKNSGILNPICIELYRNKKDFRLDHLTFFVFFMNFSYYIYQNKLSEKYVITKQQQYCVC